MATKQSTPGIVNLQVYWWLGAIYISKTCNVKHKCNVCPWPCKCVRFVQENTVLLALWIDVLQWTWVCKNPWSLLRRWWNVFSCCCFSVEFCIYFKVIYVNDWHIFINRGNVLTHAVYYRDPVYLFLMGEWNVGVLLDMSNETLVLVAWLDRRHTVKLIVKFKNMV